MAQGLGSNLSYNFTKIWALKANYGGNWNRFASNSAFTIGPKVTWRGDGINFFVHTLLGVDRFSSVGVVRGGPFVGPSNGIAAVLGGGMDLKIWKPLWFRLFEADYQLERVNLSGNVPPDDSALAASDFQRRPPYDRSGLQLWWSSRSIGISRLLGATHRRHGRRAGARHRRRQQLQSQAHAHLYLGEQWRQS